MAGSYRHVADGPRGFRFDLIENMGDAHEACEMMYWMIQTLAGSQEAIEAAESRYYQYARGELPHPAIFDRRDIDEE